MLTNYTMMPCLPGPSPRRWIERKRIFDLWTNHSRNAGGIHRSDRPGDGPDMEARVGIEPHDCACADAASPCPTVRLDEKRPPTQEGRFCYVMLWCCNSPHQLPLAFTVCCSTAPIWQARSPGSTGGGCGRTCAQGCARAIYSFMGLRLLPFCIQHFSGKALGIPPLCGLLPVGDIPSGLDRSVVIAQTPGMGIHLTTR